MSYVVNVAIADTWTFRDVAGALVTGKTNGDFTKAAYLPDPDNPGSVLATATVTVAAVSGQSGDYGATFTPSVVGKNWRVVVSCLHSDGETYAWEETFEVVTAAQADPATGLAALPVGGTSGTWGAALALVRSNVVDGVVPEALDASLRITQGHDYLLADDRHFLWTTNEAATWPTLTGAAIEFVIDQRIRDATAPGAVVQATGVNKSVRVELTQSFTRALRTGRFVFGVEATLASGSRIGLVGGTADVVTV